ncbi:HD domain-containing protein [Rickettsia hoogstraalii]|uniref:HD domain-containing protein n=1 Tax=Rickettsia hoogstraalii TaxID=467174 RepID=UPI0022532B8B|nr:HD domain-containing protein [Rickettsia hoogstraalii]MCX4084035.1 HD domain-containing protein [Rickettsia hoogstraalii]
MEDISSWKEKFEICVYSKKSLDKLEYLNTKVENPIDILEIKKGIYYARKYHGSQMHQSGDPYYSHPIEVAIMLAEFVDEEAPKLYNVIMLQAALLHDTIEDTELTEEAITEIFGSEVAKHVEGLTRIKSYGKISSGKSLNLLIKEKRYNTALIKLFDRIHNVQTLGVKSPEKARKIIEETLINFLLVAANINYKLEREFAELCLKVFNIELERQKTFSNNNSLLPPLTL